MSKLDKKIGFIGAGNMGQAILGGMLRAGLIDATQAMVSDVSAEQLEKVEQKFQACIARDNQQVASFADVIILAVKPFQAGTVASEIRPGVRDGQLFVTILAGVTTKFFEEQLGPGAHVVRAMPNTPAMIGCGSTGIAPGSRATKADLDIVLRIFNSVGKAIVTTEDKLDLITGLTGSGPAYVYYFMEALIDAARELGLAEKDAAGLVYQMVQGAARVAMDLDQPLTDLRRAVTTKGGTTEAGMRQLEQGDFAGLIRRCVEAATKRSSELSSGKM